MPSFPPLRVVLHPRWWPLHIFTVAVVAGMVFMGRWQWHVAHRHAGDIRNYAYAVQWWAFTGFAFLMWWRVLRDSQVDASESLQSDSGESRNGHDASSAPAAYVGYEPPKTYAQPDDRDAEVRAYNEYLASLNDKQEDTQ